MSKLSVNTNFLSISCQIFILTISILTWRVKVLHGKFWQLLNVIAPCLNVLKEKIVWTKFQTFGVKRRKSLADFQSQKSREKTTLNLLPRDLQILSKFFLVRVNIPFRFNDCNLRFYRLFV